MIILFNYGAVTHFQFAPTNGLTRAWMVGPGGAVAPTPTGVGKQFIVNVGRMMTP